VDLGLRIRRLPGGGSTLESHKGLLDDFTAGVASETARTAGLRAQSMFTYVVNAIRSGEHEVPYSLVTGVEGGVTAINEWTAERLGASAGASVTLEYFVWTDGGRLETRSTALQVDRVIPVAAADPDFAPAYPGISDTNSLADWDPPFPIDLSRVRPEDEAYWDRYRTTPKMLVPLEKAQELWGTRWGRVSSIRLTGTDEQLAAFEPAFHSALDPAAAGLVLVPVREQSLRAAAGATDFGQYFTYFSFFITVAALLLAALFFRLGLEQRLQQIGLLRAVGYAPAKLRRLFLLESSAVAAAGAAIGVLGALAYAWLIMHGLRTWWVGAVGTTNLELHPSAVPLAAGIGGGLIAGLTTIVYTLRAMSRATPRALLSGEMSAAFRHPRRRRRIGPGTAALALAILALAFTLASMLNLLSEVAGFFGAGTLLLAAALAAFSSRLARRPRTELADRPTGGVSRLGIRYASWRRGRSVLSAALIASAVFLIVSVEAFRRDAPEDSSALRSGTGGASLVAESLLPIVYHPDTEEGRQALNLLPDSSSGDIPAFASHRSGSAKETMRAA
jgi:hypothetical protein